MEPKGRAREKIDLQLDECGWQVLSRDELNIYASGIVAGREFALSGDGDPRLREGRLPRRRHPAHRARGVRQGQRLLP